MVYWTPSRLSSGCMFPRVRSATQAGEGCATRPGGLLLLEVAQRERFKLGLVERLAAHKPVAAAGTARQNGE